ncbi:MAG TPA: DUF1003 domain-containing protein [Frankiaceae bacterium]|nr:DUF1003 domain-containing protein [Frankiaceae bacterium]
MAQRRGQRLDQPRVLRRGLPRPHYDPEAFGRFSETIARFIGTARFLVIQTVIVIVWIAYNGWMGLQHHRDNAECARAITAASEARQPRPDCDPDKEVFDPYPFILLTLALSLQAAYAAPLILLAQNRQADRDRISLEEDRAQYARSIADTEYLTREVAAVRIALGDVATRDYLRSELQHLLDELKRADDED